MKSVSAFFNLTPVEAVKSGIFFWEKFVGPLGKLTRNYFTFQSLSGFNSLLERILGWKRKNIRNRMFYIILYHKTKLGEDPFVASSENLSLRTQLINFLKSKCFLNGDPARMTSKSPLGNLSLIFRFCRGSCQQTQ